MLVNSDFDITILKVVAANRLYNTPASGTVYRRNRKRWAVALKRSGKTYYTVNGTQVLSDSQHPVILPKGCSYSWRCVEEGECLIIEFDALQAQSHILSFTLTDNSFFINDFLKIQKMLPLSTPEAGLESVYSLYGLLLQLCKTVQKEYIPRDKPQLLRPALDYIAESYYLPDITNDRLAQLCGISTVYFRKCFEAVCGVSPIRYLHDFRIRKAKDLLSSDYGSIGQVAESVGYNGIYHFSKMFKLYTGMSPTEYAKVSRK